MATDDAQDAPADRVAEQRSLYGEQDEWGNDIAQLRANLRLTPIKRLRKAEQGARFAAKYKGIIYRRPCS